ncbi:MAG: ATP-binding protein [Gemmobacter sp.]|uniref:ATP-binding protein n=1 Tax=Gemmobacter sp. TaxID=1898957 RepID=UPI003919DCDB
MRPRSLQARLALSLGVLLTALWAAGAVATGFVLQREMDRVFDSALQETAQRLLPLAVIDILGREEAGVTQRLGAIRPHEEYFTYIVRDDAGQVLLQSHGADPALFPAWAGPGFATTGSHRLYSDAAVRDTVRITVAEPLAHRAAVARELRLGLVAPLLVVVPLALGAIVLAVQASLAPLRRLRDSLAARNARDLAPLAGTGLPSEIAPVVAALNDLLARLDGAFQAERSFAANAAHELRTPLAGAIAQAQRLQAESADPAAVARAADIEATLKRLTRLSERLLQLARAEGGRLRQDRATDLRAIAQMVAADLGRGLPPGRIALCLPETPVMSDLDPDAFGILCRNLLDNALRHGASQGPVDLTLQPDGRLCVANDGPVVPPEVLARLTARFERAGGRAEGSGLGLAIVAAIAERIGSDLTLHSPRPRQASGFQVCLQLPLAG